ncbi:methyltransferase [Candidatus Roizmanbacteria bacterium]|nr:methyltransferase [Candidatus Roizmanbacteria bacterium]
MTNIQAIKQHQEALLQKLKSRQKPEKYSIGGFDVMVNPQVFPPATDTKLLVVHVRCQKGDRIIDLTTGSGSLAIAAGLQGATGYAVDINPDAVRNATENLQRYNLTITVIQSDFFQNIPPEQFDQIFANGPFFEGDINDPLDHACYGVRKFIDDLFSQVFDRLKPDGKLLIVMADWCDLEYFEKTVKKNNLQSTYIASQTSDDGERTYNLYEITK